ncbi:hypothetical protein BD410DRAFT_780399 [Rickenella mellea]|uniref:Cation/H+ exchanger transmembrane domain-containing protein n=1 Tax=Rickenella mellea TaxID=50990 RepID=A0A4R5XFE8_9AGAM|nr:hypothetical protein BD410DRAFT_780399 [Rickenella mellea]
MSLSGSLSGDFTLLAGRLVSRAAKPQGGVISGDNPSTYNASDPLRLWIIQVGIIIVFTQLLSLLLSRIRQPRVIAEVIGGVILGPTVMGRIPHFTQRIFPSQSIPLLTLTANIGLVFFLFLVGLEIDIRVMKRSARKSSLISVAGLVLPFGLGAAVAVPLYHNFINPTINYGYFILFVAVAIGITAFPVLCRILTELRLLDTTVGVVVLSAGVGNDVVGWILLALSVALVNASTGLTALWVLLTSAAYVIFLLFPVRWGFLWLARKTGSLENGQPTALVMTATLLLVLVSAFFTDIIGVHPIFGGFLAGLIVPHEGGFAIAFVEKLEDLICIVFLPIYFTLSGLNTNLGLLDNGKTWAYTILICVVAFFGKFVGCFVTAKLTGFSLRESGAIGTLMSCKGLVELIVLNVGLQAGILDTRVFSMFVVHALVLTCMTTPLTLLWYPPKYRDVVGAAKRKLQEEKPSTSGVEPKKTFAVVLNKVDHLPAIMTLTQLLQTNASSRPSSTLISNSGSESNEKEKSAMVSYSKDAITVNALRLIELTARTSAVLKSQEADYLINRDSIISVFRTFGYLNRIPVTAALSVINQDEFATRVANHAKDTGSQMIVIPWNSGPYTTQPAAAEDLSSPTGAGPAAITYNPFGDLFTTKGDKASSVVYSQFVRKVFIESGTDVALFVDRGNAAVSNTSYGHHLLLPFFGGPDDRLALAFVVQLCENSNITASVVRIKKTDKLEPVDSIDAAKQEAANQLTAQSANASGFPDTVYGAHNTETRLASDTADNILWSNYTTGASNLLPNTAAALKRITFTEQATSDPLHSIIALAANEAKGTAESWRSLIVVLGRGRRMASETHQKELRQVIADYGTVGNEVPRTMGDVAAALVAADTTASLLVLQAAYAASTDV